MTNDGKKRSSAAVWRAYIQVLRNGLNAVPDRSDDPDERYLYVDSRTSGVDVVDAAGWVVGRDAGYVGQSA